MRLKAIHQACNQFSLSVAYYRNIGGHDRENSRENGGVESINLNVGGDRQRQRMQNTSSYSFRIGHLCLKRVCRNSVSEIHYVLLHF